MGPCNTWKNGMDIERTDTFESQKDYKGTYGLIYDHTLFGFTLLWLNTTNSFFFLAVGGEEQQPLTCAYFYPFFYFW